jgi:AcrR family transcriptional regulator
MADKTPDIHNRPKPMPRRYRDLINIATELFSELGYEGTSVRKIADRMGIKSASLYSHIESKEKVLREIVLDVAEEFLTNGRRIVKNVEEPEARLRQLCRAHLGVMNRRHQAVVVYFHQWRKLDPQDQYEIVRLRHEYEDMFRTAIVEGTKAGVFDVDDPHVAMLVVLGTLNWTYEWYSPSGPLSVEQLSDGLLRVVMGGLRRTGSEPTP